MGTLREGLRLVFVAAALTACGLENKATSGAPVEDPNGAETAVAELRQMAETVSIGTTCRLTERSEAASGSATIWEVVRNGEPQARFTVDTSANAPRAPTAKREQRDGVPYWRIDLDAAPGAESALSMSWEVREDSAATTAFALTRDATPEFSLSDCL